MSDGSCSYPEDGYDCEGNELQFPWVLMVILKCQIL